MKDPNEHDVSAAGVLMLRLKAAIDHELRAYPYPITACDVAFKLLTEQREQCRVALSGLAVRDGLTAADAGVAMAALLATPLPVKPDERTALQALARAISIGQPA